MTQTNTVSASSVLLLLAATLALLLAGCDRASVGFGVGTGGSHVGVGMGMGMGGSSVGVGVGGFGLSLNSAGDFLNNGPTEAYTKNKEGINQLLDGKLDAARQTFESLLEEYPEHPDATYYLGLTLIYLDRREEGFELLKSYRDPHYYRGTSAVQRMAAYLEKKPELTAREIHDAMNRERVDGYQWDLRERQELNRGL